MCRKGAERFAILLMTAWAACASDPPAPSPFAEQPPELQGIEVDEFGFYRVAFGEVAVGSAASREARLVHRGTRRLEVVASEFKPPFDMVVGRSWLEPEGEVPITFLFQPSRNGTFREELQIVAGDTEFTIVVEGEGRKTQEEPCEWKVEGKELVFTLLPEPPPFPRVARVWIQSLGEGSCTLTGMRIEGDERFRVEGGSGTVHLPQGSSVSVEVSFEGNEQAEGTLTFTISGAEVRIPLSTADEPRCAQLDLKEESAAVGIGCTSRLAEIAWSCPEWIAPSVRATDKKGLSVQLSPRPLEGAVDVWAGRSFVEGFDLDAVAEPTILVSFDNGDAIAFRSSVVVEKEVTILDGEWIDDLSFRVWELERLPSDLDEDGTLTSEDGIVVRMGDRGIPQRKPLEGGEPGPFQWRFSTPHNRFMINTFHVPLEDDDVPEIWAPVVCGE